MGFSQWLQVLMPLFRNRAPAKAAAPADSAEERARNIHVKDSVSEDEFVRMRTARDKTLGMPHLLLPSLQVNVRAGEIPKAEDNGLVYLKIPINAF